MLRFGKLALLLLILPALQAASKSAALPNSFAGWTGSVKTGLTQPEIFNGDKATSTIVNEQLGALQEYGLESGEEGAYTRGNDKLEVALYRMKDPSGAYGEFTFLRTPEMATAKIGENAAISNDRAVVQTGNLVLDIHGSKLKEAEKDLNALIAIVGPHAEHGPLPFLRQRLPEKDMLEHSDRYIVGPNVLGNSLPALPGDWLGLTDDAEAELAKYRIKGSEATLVIADFPTPQMASRRLVKMEKEYNVNAAAPKDGYPPIFAKRALTMLAITIGPRTKHDAEILLDQVHSETELTWNEPSFTATEPSMVAMLVGTFIGTGIICLFAMIASLAFGGARLLIKRALPNKVFDRSSEMEILQLGLSSKPINAEDFYGFGRSSGK
ncbi:MAG TPA: DUF6599 family protein [Candidatus Acidoferrales bacterium]|nr:DUF6599 family protein [Candidatus Acidoferrales bacterium]